MHTFRLNTLLLLAISALMAHSVQAATYRWVDQNGKVQYSDVMPPAMAGQGHTELDKQGRVIKEIRRTRMTPEEQQRQTEAASRQDEEKRKELERRRRDLALLSTYNSEKEIALARDRAIELESLHIRGLQTRLDTAAAQLAEANTKLTQYQRIGKPAPANYTQMRDEAQRELAQISASMNLRTQAVEDIHLRFEADLKRFLELKAANR
mgnify:CR=1 FL=1